MPDAAQQWWNDKAAQISGKAPLLWSQAAPLLKSAGVTGARLERARESYLTDYASKQAPAIKHAIGLDQQQFHKAAGFTPVSGINPLSELGGGLQQSFLGQIASRMAAGAQLPLPQFGDNVAGDPGFAGTVAAPLLRTAAQFGTDWATLGKAGQAVRKIPGVGPALDAAAGKVGSAIGPALKRFGALGPGRLPVGDLTPYVKGAITHGIPAGGVMAGGTAAAGGSPQDVARAGLMGLMMPVKGEGGSAEPEVPIADLQAAEAAKQADAAQAQAAQPPIGPQAPEVAPEPPPPEPNPADQIIAAAQERAAQPPPPPIPQLQPGGSQGSLPPAPRVASGPFSMPGEVAPAGTPMSGIEIPGMGTFSGGSGVPEPGAPLPYVAARHAIQGEWTDPARTPQTLGDLSPEGQAKTAKEAAKAQATAAQDQAKLAATKADAAASSLGDIAKHIQSLTKGAEGREMTDHEQELLDSLKSAHYDILDRVRAQHGAPPGFGEGVDAPLPALPPVTEGLTDANAQGQIAQDDLGQHLGGSQELQGDGEVRQQQAEVPQEGHEADRGSGLPNSREEVAAVVGGPAPNTPSSVAPTAPTSAAEAVTRTLPAKAQAAINRVSDIARDLLKPSYQSTKAVEEAVDAAKAPSVRAKIQAAIAAGDTKGATQIESDAKADAMRVTEQLRRAKAAKSSADATAAFLHHDVLGKTTQGQRVAMALFGLEERRNAIIRDAAQRAADKGEPFDPADVQVPPVPDWIKPLIAHPETQAAIEKWKTQINGPGDRWRESLGGSTQKTDSGMFFPLMPIKAGDPFHLAVDANGDIHVGDLADENTARAFGGQGTSRKSVGQQEHVGGVNSHMATGKGQMWEIDPDVAIQRMLRDKPNYERQQYLFAANEKGLAVSRDDWNAATKAAIKQNKAITEKNKVNAAAGLPPEKLEPMPGEGMKDAAGKPIPWKEVEFSSEEAPTEDPDGGPGAGIAGRYSRYFMMPKPLADEYTELVNGPHKIVKNEGVRQFFSAINNRIVGASLGAPVEATTHAYMNLSALAGQAHNWGVNPETFLRHLVPLIGPKAGAALEVSRVDLKNPSDMRIARGLVDMASMRSSVQHDVMGSGEAHGGLGRALAAYDKGVGVVTKLPGIAQGKGLMDGVRKAVFDMPDEYKSGMAALFDPKTAGLEWKFRIASVKVVEQMLGRELKPLEMAEVSDKFGVYAADIQSGFVRAAKGLGDAFVGRHSQFIPNAIKQSVGWLDMPGMNELSKNQRLAASADMLLAGPVGVALGTIALNMTFNDGKTGMGDIPGLAPGDVRVNFGGHPFDIPGYVINPVTALAERLIGVRPILQGIQQGKSVAEGVQIAVDQWKRNIINAVLNEVGGPTAKTLWRAATGQELYLQRDNQGKMVPLQSAPQLGKHAGPLAQDAMNVGSAALKAYPMADLAYNIAAPYAGLPAAKNPQFANAKDANRNALERGIGAISPIKINEPYMMPTLDAWGRETGNVFHQPEQTKLDTEVERLGFTVPAAGKKLGKVALSPEDYTRYATTAGGKAREFAERLVANPGWDKLTDEQKVHELKSAIQKAHIYAKAVMSRKP